MADLRFAGPALVLPEVPVQEDGTVHVPNENLPKGWHACTLESSRSFLDFPLAAFATMLCKTCQDMDQALEVYSSIPTHFEIIWLHGGCP
jgi:hypothetical protein